MLAGTTFTHFEARHTHSIGLTPDGTRLLALNTNDGRLSLFDISNAANAVPVLIKEIPVGLEPISLRARTNDEVWVVSEVGDSVSVVSLGRALVVDVLRASDEPADVVFAQGKAFVSCARNNLLRVFDGVGRQELASIALHGLVPRALATDGAGTKVYAAFLHSGNNTTVLPSSQAPPQPSRPTPPCPRRRRPRSSSARAIRALTTRSPIAMSPRSMLTRTRSLVTSAERARASLISPCIQRRATSG